MSDLPDGSASRNLQIKKAGADESSIIAAKLLLNLQGEKAVSWGLMVTTVCTLNWEEIDLDWEMLVSTTMLCHMMDVVLCNVSICTSGYIVIGHTSSNVRNFHAYKPVVCCTHSESCVCVLSSLYFAIELLSKLAVSPAKHIN